MGIKNNNLDLSNELTFSVKVDLNIENDNINNYSNSSFNYS